MLDGVKHVRAAADLLKGEEQHLSERVLMAAAHWWRALAHHDHWPALLQGKADCIAAKLLSHGSLPISVAAMDDEQLLDLARDIQAFAREMEDEHEMVGVGADDVYIAYPFH